MSSGGALAGVAAVNELAHFVMFNEFATVGCGDAFFDFAQKPVLIAQHALDGFDDEGLAFPSFSAATRASFSSSWRSKCTSMKSD